MERSGICRLAGLCAHDRRLRVRRRAEENSNQHHRAFDSFETFDSFEQFFPMNQFKGIDSQIKIDPYARD